MHKYLTFFLLAFTLCSQPLWAAGGEDCGTATVIPGLPYTDNGSTAAALDDYDEVCPFTNPGAPDVVYQYTPATTVVVDVSLCQATTNYDTKLYIYENTCPAAGGGSSGVFYACNDDACFAPLFPNPWVSSINGVVMVAGNTYYIVVDGYDNFSNGDYTIDIGATPGDGAPVSVVSPNLMGCPFTATEPVTFTYTNLGTDVDSMFLSLVVDGSLVVKDTVLGLVTATDTLTHTFSASADLSAPGLHEVRVVASAPNDGNFLNDTLSSRVLSQPTQAYPFPSVDFTGFNGGNLNTLSPQWIEGGGDLVLSEFPNPFFIGWNPGDVTQTALLGSETAQINLFFTFNRAWLVGPRFTAGPGYRLNFKAAIMEFFGTGPSAMGSDDAVSVLVSTDCGLTWTPILIIDQNNAPGNTFASFQADLSSFAGQDVIVAFYATDGTVFDPEDYNFHLDDIEIIDIFQTDVTAAAITSPASSGCGLGNNELVTAQLDNIGSPIADMFATLIVDGVPVVTDTLAGPFLTGNTVSHTFSQGANLSTAGLHTIDVIATTTGDANPTNDTISSIVDNILPVSFPIPTLTFDGYGFNDINLLYPLWFEGFGNPPTVTPFSGWNGSNILPSTTASVNIFSSFTNEWLLGPLVEVTSQTRIRFDAAITQFFGPGPATMDADDSLNVMISTDCGVTWTSIFAIDQNNQPSNVLTPFEVDLSPYSGQSVYVAFYAASNSPGGDLDAHIDNVQVANFFPVDVGVTSILSPSDGCDLTDTEAITCEFTHLGTDTVFGPVTIPMGYTLDGINVVSDSLVLGAGAVVPPGAVVPFTFATTTDLSVQDTAYQITVWTDLGDPQLVNDTLTLTRRTYAPASVSMGLDSVACTLTDSLFATPTYAGGVWSGLGITDTLTGTFDPAVVGNGNTSTITYRFEEAYGVSEIPFAPVPSAGGQTFLPLGDDDFIQVPQGFDFTFFEETFQDIFVGSNGYISFGEGYFSLINVPLPDITIPNNMIALAWDDLNPNEGGEIFSEVVGTAPNRQMVVTYDSLRGFSDPNVLVVGQIVLYEGTDVIEMHISNLTPDFNDFTQGIENGDGTVGYATTDSTNSAIFSQDSVAYRFVPTPCPGYDTLVINVGVTEIFAEDSVSFCNGDSVVLDAQNPGATYNWNTGESTQTITVNQPGSYVVDVVTAAGCNGQDTVLAINFPGIGLQIDSVRNVLCADGEDGAIFLASNGGVAPLSFLWSNGATTEDLQDVPVGTYSVTITDGAGCQFTSTEIEVQSQLDPPSADFSFTQLGTQIDFTNASTGGDSYLWSFGDSQNSTSTDENPSFFYLTGGTYTVTLVVSNPCGSDTITQTVSIATGIEEDFPQTRLALVPNPNPGRFVLEFTGASLSEVQLNVTDLRGKVLYAQTLGQVADGQRVEIDQQGRLAEGVYLLRVEASQGRVTRRVVVVSP